MSLSSLSSYRLHNTAKELCNIMLGDDCHSNRSFSVLRSKVTTPVAQFYVLPEDWKNQPSNSKRTEPLAHVFFDSKTKKLAITTWQPKKYNVKIDPSELKSKLSEIIGF